MRRVLLFVAAATAALAVAGSAQAATVVLTFDLNAFACTGVDGGATDRACTTSGEFIGADYGSTSELAVSYDASESSGSRTSLQFNAGAGGRAYSFPPGPADEPSLIFFTPTAGFEVSFESFSWSKLTATSSANFFFEVRDPDSTVLFQAGNGAGSYAVNTAYFSGPLTFAFGNGGQGSVGINQLSVDVRAIGAPPTPGVPEPATWAMMIGGFAGAGAMLRRRRTARA